ncbi:MAG TPA: protein kinase [Pyrinomonadaceae bacterium]|jgi:serine/threonine-protein kinase
MKKCPKCSKEYEDTTTLCPSDGSVLVKPNDELIGQTLADKYRIEERINEGGMGTVYRGTHILMDKTVAIKVLHPALAADDKIVARFSREARAASRISHPHALNVTDFGESENGVVFLVMEYLRGRTLKEVVQSDAPMPLPRVVEIMRQVSAALEAAHSEGVVHRDLKSDNIMLVEAGDNTDWAKVLDFGIAKIQEPVGQDPALTAPNLIIGTPQYMSPEQCSQASEIDSRSDIYSLGVILYEMLVGHVPFTGESPTAIMMKHLQDAPPSVLEERQDLPAEVGRVVARALAKRPEDRFQTASELAQGLALAAEGSAASAAASATVANAPERDTNRIVVTTGSNEAPRSTADQSYDESTLVRPPREERESGGYETQAMGAQTPPPPDSFNPWRIVVPALVGLLVVFGVIYALTRNPAQPASNQNTPLVIDPSGQPVQPQTPPTGQGEQNLNSSTPATTPSAGGNANGSLETNRNTEGATSNENSNNPNANRGNKNKQNGETENKNQAEPSNENSNQGEDPRPIDETLPPEDEDAPPPPTPTPKKKKIQPPKPVEVPTNPAPQESPSGGGLTP